MVLNKGTTSFDSFTDKTAVIILGGGKGTRLYPLTKSRAKPAVPVAGKFRLIDLPVSNCLHSNLDKIYILTQFNSDSLHRHITQTYRFDSFSHGFVQILAAQQTIDNKDWYQGTADAVRHALRRLDQRRPDHVLILSGDHLYKMDYRDMLRTHIENNANVTISVIPLPRKDCHEFGILQVDERGQVIRFVEKPKEEALLEDLRVPTHLFEDRGIAAEGREHIASMGIYIFDTNTLFESLDSHKGSDFGKDILPSLLGTKSIQAHFFDGYWEDIGTIRAFYEANLALATPVPRFNFYDERFLIYTRPRHLPGAKINQANIRSSVLCEGAIVSGSVVEDSVVGLRSIIEEGAFVSKTVMMGADYYDSPDMRFEDIPDGAPALGIGRRTIIKNTIVDKNARIAADCRIVNQENVSEADGPNYYIRDGIVVIPRGAVIPRGTVI
ncbi:MAG: glucose-1-phosphate adenylyltransferase [bacterium]|jgi:glucose-1-phosphate adenylyltransferase|nr:glucose-1-phosphate adenylyltransferase [bacterium]